MVARDTFEIVYPTSDQEAEARTGLVVSLQPVQGRLDLRLLDWKLPHSLACLILCYRSVHFS